MQSRRAVVGVEGWWERERERERVNTVGEKGAARVVVEDKQESWTRVDNLQRAKKTSRIHGAKQNNRSD